MAAVSYKAVAIAENLLQNLNFEFPLAAASTAGELAALWVLGTSSSGYPYLLASDATSTHANVLVLVTSLLSVDAIFTDSLGNAAYPFTPTIFQCVCEKNAGTGETGAILAGAGYLDVATQIKLWATLGQTGVQIQLYQSANGTATTAGFLAAITGAPIVTFDSIQYPGTASM